jgi:hypothetical protein
MLPGVPTFYRSDHAMRDAHFARQFRHAPTLGKLLANISNICLNQFCRPMMAFTFRCLVAALRHFVSHVICLRADPKMRWIDAGWRIAGVHDDDPPGHRHSMVEFICNAMRGNQTASATTYADASISFLAISHGSLPEPAFFRFSEGKPLMKPDSKWNELSLTRHSDNIAVETM